MASKKSLAILLALAVILTGCNFPTSSEPREDAAAQVQTAAAETVNAQFTLNAELTPEDTATPEPSNTPEPTATEEATATEAAATATTAEACDSIFFVADVTIPDGSEINAGDSFTKTWRLRNAGTCTWTSDYDLVFDSGTAMDGPAAQALAGDVAPGEEVDVSVVLTAPAAEGEYTGYWKLRNAAGVVFGLPDAFYVEIEVVAGGGGGAGSNTVTLAATDRGSVRSDSSTNPNPNTGDTDGDVGSQAFVSFDISSIPAGATITQVRVDFTDYDTLGDPFTALGCLRAYQGSFFALDAGDYFAGAPLGAVLRWCNTGELSADFLDEDVESSLQSALGAGTYELRLQFNETETNGDGVADMVRFGTIELEVTYTGP